MTARLAGLRDHRHPSSVARHEYKPTVLHRVNCRNCRALLTPENTAASRFTVSGLSPYCRACHDAVTARSVPRPVQEARLSATWSRYAREFGADSAPAVAAHRALAAFRAEGVQS